MIVPGCWQASFFLRRPRQPQPAVEAEVVVAAAAERVADPALEQLAQALLLRAQLLVADAAAQPDKLQAAPQEQAEAVAVAAVEAAALRQQLQPQPLRLPRLP